MEPKIQIDLLLATFSLSLCKALLQYHLVWKPSCCPDSSTLNHVLIYSKMHVETQELEKKQGTYRHIHVEYSFHVGSSICLSCRAFVVTLGAVGNWQILVVQLIPFCKLQIGVSLFPSMYFPTSFFTQDQIPAMLGRISNKGLHDVKVWFGYLRATLSYFCLVAKAFPKIRSTAYHRWQEICCDISPSAALLWLSALLPNNELTIWSRHYRRGCWFRFVQKPPLELWNPFWRLGSRFLGRPGPVGSREQ